MNGFPLPCAAEYQYNAALYPSPDAPLDGTALTGFRNTGLVRGSGWAILCQDPQIKAVNKHWISDHEAGHIGGPKPILLMADPSLYGRGSQRFQRRLISIGDPNRGGETVWQR